MTEIKPFIKKLGEQHVTLQNKNKPSNPVERAYSSNITYNNAKNSFNGEEEFGSSNKSKNFQLFKNKKKDNFSSSPNNLHSSNTYQNSTEKNAIEQATNSSKSPSRYYLFVYLFLICF